jgi:CRISPR-associated endonuclease Csy4
MNYYMEITLLPNPDINLFSLWSKIYQQIHLGLVEMQDGQCRVPIGVSFPEYVKGDKYGVLGGKLRLFAEHEATLSQFNVGYWLARLSDYVHCTGIRPVPERLSGHAIYRRVQPKNNPIRLARRYARRHEMELEEALGHYKGMAPVSIQSPFIQLKSLSSGETFCLWIARIPATESSAGSFSSYGLSTTSTVPEF